MIIRMFIQICVFILLFKGSNGVSPPLSSKELSELDPLLQKSIEKSSNRGSTHIHQYRTSFQYKYVLNNGDIHSTQPNGTPVVTITATSNVPEVALSTAAHTISLVVRHMPSDIFNTLATKLGVGIFTKAETLTVFPENAKYRDTPECKGRCDGNCSITCLSDGRKIDTIAGMSNHHRTVVLDDNVLCDEQDPYGHKENILVHEFGHLVMDSFPRDLKNRLLYVYDYIIKHNVWTSSYATSNADEYWAEATTSYFGAITRDGPAGGMNNVICHVTNTVPPIDKR